MYSYQKSGRADPMFEKFNFDLIYRERDDFTPLVVMMCGVAGSGKTTFSQQLEKEGFVRLSIDEAYSTKNMQYSHSAKQIPLRTEWDFSNCLSCYFTILFNIIITC
jgi:septin family protein